MCIATAFEKFGNCEFERNPKPHVCQSKTAVVPRVKIRAQL